MRVLITAVGHRTEHWTDLFTLLAGQPDLQLTIVTADVSPLTEQILGRLADRSAQLTYSHLPHVISEARSGHMASVVFRPRALRALDVGEPDVIHIIGEAAYLSTGQIIRWRDRFHPHVPLTCYAAQNVVTRFPFPFPLLESRAYRAIDEFFPITDAALNVLRSKGYQGAASIVPLGVDTGLFAPPSTPAPPRRFTVGFVGRLEEHKGIRDLLSAVQRLGCDLLVVGDGMQADLVRAAADRAPDRVRLHSWVDHDELPSLMHQMDVLALPSAEIMQRNVLPWVAIPLREQFGRVLVEAMACGIPVVGSDVGEIPNIVGDGGLVYPSGNVDALADRLATLRDDPAKARLMGANGAARVADQFGWDRAAATMSQIWRRWSVASAGRPDPPPPSVPDDSTTTPPVTALTTGK